MNFAEFIKTRKLSFWFRAALVILCIVPIIYTALKAAVIPQYPVAIVFMVLGAASGIVTLVMPDKAFTDYVAIAAVVFASLAFGFFLVGGVPSIGDYIADVNFWGDSSQFGSIVAYSVILFCGASLGVASCYIK